MEPELFPENVIFTVFGFLHEEDPHTHEQSVSMQILGNFTTLEQAVLCKDIYQDADTTIQGVSIANSVLFDEMQDVDVMLHISVDENNTLTVRTQVVSINEDPYLYDKDRFEALAYHEDEEYILEYAQQWCKKKFGKYPAIVDEKSPNAEFFLS